MPSLNGDSKLRLRSHVITERRFKVTVVVTCSDTRIFLSVITSCEDTPTCFLLSAGASESTPFLRHLLSCDFLRRYANLFLRLRRRLRIDVTGYLRRHPLSCDFLRDTPTRILVSVGASESTSLDISAAIPSVATSCEIRRLVS